MRLFRRSPKPVPPPSAALATGEEVERAVRATLLQGKAALAGRLFMTDRRLLFEADKGDARWMSVPFDEVKSAGLYPFPRTAMGAPGSRGQSLFVETTKGEQVWWDFAARDEQAWLPLVRERAQAARPAHADEE